LLVWPAGIGWAKYQAGQSVNSRFLASLASLYRMG
jgi:hypothetical protein